MARILAFLTFVTLSQTTFAQDPCATEPFKGYKGKCNNVTSFVSFDGKFLYTSDQLTLKKWDLKTKKIVHETDPFTSSLQVISDIPEYNSASRIDDPAINALLAKNKMIAQTGFNSGSQWILARKDSKIVKINIANGSKVSPTDFNEVYYYTHLNLALASDKDGAVFIFDLTTGAIVKSDLYVNSLRDVQHTPDNKYLIIEGVDVFSLVDLKTGKLMGSVRGQGNFSFNSDLSRMFFLRQEMLRNGNNIFQSIIEYSYPDMKEIKRIDKTDSKFMKSYDRVQAVMMDADRQVVYIRGYDHDDDPLLLIGHKYPEGEVVDTFSLKKTETREERIVDTKRKEANLNIANKAIGLLNAVEEQSPRHSWEKVRFMHIDDFTPDGKMVLIREEYFRGSGVIMWAFPEGKPRLLLYNEEKVDGLGGNSIFMESSIQRSFISPSGKTVGINSKQKSFIVRDNAVKFELPDKLIIALYDDVVLTYTVNPAKNIWSFQNLELISIATGQVIQKIAGPAIPPTATVNTRFKSGKVYFYDATAMHIFDINTPASLKSYALPGVVPDAPLYEMSNQKGISIMNFGTGKEENIPGYRMAQGTYEASAADGGMYLLANRYESGWNVYNIQEGKRAVAQNFYCGWTGFEDAAYMKDANKILVVNRSSSYTRPNAADEDPGASAYMIDVTTNAIIPYLLGEKRSVQVAARKLDAQWQYTPPTDCEAQTSKFHDRWIIKEGERGAEYMYLGYDCEEKVFVVAQRVTDSHEGVNFKVVRFLKMPPESLQNFSNHQGPFEICPNCGGVAGGVVDTYYSGWSNWEQKYANIYTRKYVVNQKIKVLKHCQVCNGEAWYRAR